MKKTKELHINNCQFLSPSGKNWTLDCCAVTRTSTKSKLQVSFGVWKIKVEE